MTHRAAAVSGYRYGAPSLSDTFAEKRYIIGYQGYPAYAGCPGPIKLYNRDSCELTSIGCRYNVEEKVVI